MPREPIRKIRRQIHAELNDLPKEAWKPGAVNKSVGRIRLKPRTDRNGVVTNLPPIDAEMLDRLYEADPLGFLIAAMNGQPLPEIHVDEQGKNPSLRYVTLAPEHRADVADTLVRYMASGFFKNEKPTPNPAREKPDEYRSMMDNAARRAVME